MSTRHNQTVFKPNYFTGMTRAELESRLNEIGEPSYRGQQLYEWIYQQRVSDFQAMTNLPQPLRDRLEKSADIHPLTLSNVQGKPGDSTRKYLFRLPNDVPVETVYMLQDDGRVTLCLSTQVGCALDCKFCATATLGFQRNLTPGEIVDQYLRVEEQEQRAVTNIVFMGMGEPFLNYQRSIAAARLLSDPDGIGLSARRITLSTVGIVPKILQFTENRERFKLAISLNGTTDKQRTAIMPINESYPLTELLAAAYDYTITARQPITLEYVLLDHVNDSPADAQRLIGLLSRIHCKLNMIPYNDIGGEFRRPSRKRIDHFMAELKNSPFPVTVRWSKGTDIDAGCGQLAGKSGKQNQSI